MDTAPLRTARSTYDIYREHLNTVYRVAFTYMKNPFDAEDATQETFARFFRTLPKYVQENLLQSGVVFRTEADLRRCAAYLMDTDGRKH